MYDKRIRLRKQLGEINKKIKNPGIPPKSSRTVMHSITEETDSKNEGTKDQSFIYNDIKILSKSRYKLPPLADQINELNKNLI